MTMTSLEYAIGMTTRLLIATLLSTSLRARTVLAGALLFALSACTTAPTPPPAPVPTPVAVPAPAEAPVAPPALPVVEVSAPTPPAVEAPIVREVPPVPLPSYAKRGKRLPADGGAPGRAVLAYCQLFEIEKDAASYFKRLQRRGQLPSKAEVAARSAQANEPLTVQQIVERDWALRRESLRASPQRCKVQGGAIDGATAHIVLDADINGKRQRGTATLTQNAGKWRVRDHGDWAAVK